MCSIIDAFQASSPKTQAGCEVDLFLLLIRVIRIVCRRRLGTGFPSYRLAGNLAPS
ncbi:hypothetical protein [Sphingomonas abietis]|uniref:Uncharacterized protein n=1 Tax=Sphingomonas abietis TaxID=3012344 RepID=A0ABY7NWL3_9SPHN|nr:hypothetical protein [Sphingomonas abietis]WBO24299.1 hypothetical protein PBT88_09460 [Sphingomonas abietis]